MRILLSGGAGYIGCHTCLVLADRGHNVVIADNFSNSSPAVLARLERLIGFAPDSRTVDVRDGVALAGLFAGARFDAVIHFAALIAVGESCERPLSSSRTYPARMATIRALRPPWATITSARLI